MRPSRLDTEGAKHIGGRTSREPSAKGEHEEWNCSIIRLEYLDPCTILAPGSSRQGGIALQKRERGSEESAKHIWSRLHISYNSQKNRCGIFHSGTPELKIPQHSLLRGLRELLFKNSFLKLVQISEDQW